MHVVHHIMHADVLWELALSRREVILVDLEM